MRKLSINMLRTLIFFEVVFQNRQIFDNDFQITNVFNRFML